MVPNEIITFSLWSFPGGTKWCFLVYILDDKIVEDSEQLTLQLVSNNPLVMVDENYSTITLTIVEEDHDCKFLYGKVNQSNQVRQRENVK